jgi:preprotein translocase subunit SecG
MRRSRRGGGGSHSEFASSGEDSFVAVVVTKLTGALLFILLLTMVIMALLPKAVDLADPDSATKADSASTEKPAPLEITTPATLPDAVAGRPYLVALAATGGRGPRHWSASGDLPEWLVLDESTGRLSGKPTKPSDKPISIVLEVNDGKATVSQVSRLEILTAQTPFSLAQTLRNLRIPRAIGRAWLEQGVGFLILWLIHLIGMNLLANLERTSIEEGLDGVADSQILVAKRFTTYRLAVRLATLSAMLSLAAWLVFANTHAL